MTFFKNIPLLAVAFMSLVSCVNEVETAVVPSEVCEVGFSMPVDATRTSLDPDGKTTRWTPGDKLAVWAKNADGSYAFENVEFMLRYYSEAYDKAYFTSNIAAMEEGEYTYLLSYPFTKSTNGTQATYTLPAVQNGTYDGRYDIMLAEPVVEGALTSSKRVELNTVMRHQMHALKITIPEKSSNFDNKVYSVEITFPNPVAGDITIDVSNPDAKPVYSNTSNTITVKSNKGFDVGSDIWVFVLPGTVSGDVSYRIYGAEQRSVVSTYSLEREFVSGHVTPVRMAMPEFDKYTVLNFSIGENYLGEDFNFFTLYDNNGANMGTFYRNAENKYSWTYEGELDAAKLNNVDWKLVFDSDNAIVENSVNLGTVKLYHQNDISTPVDVPYLLFQDFNNATETESYGNNSYEGGDERKQPGVALNGTLSGWNAARFWLKPGAIRINARYQATSQVFQSSHYGRVDTPLLGNGTRGLKSNANVLIKVLFDAAYYVIGASSSDGLTVNSTTLCMTTHTNASNPIDGIPTGVEGISWTGIKEYDTTLDDFGPVVGRAENMKGVGSEAFGEEYSPYSVEVMNVTASTRLCFYPIMATSASALTIGNCETSVYIDNIRVSIAK